MHYAILFNVGVYVNDTTLVYQGDTPFQHYTLHV